MDRKEKAKNQFAQHLLKVMEAYSESKGSKLSLRQLAAKSGLEYSHVQRISKGQVDLAMTTIIALAEGLEVSPKELLDFAD